MDSVVSVANIGLPDSPQVVSNIHTFNRDCEEFLVTLPCKPFVSEMSFKKQYYTVGSKFCFAAYKLYDFNQVTHPLWASMSKSTR